LAGTETFDNVDNLIKGTGTINHQLTLDNTSNIDTIYALLSLNTGHQIDKDAGGILEASASSTLEIDDSLNNDGQLNTNGGTIDFKGLSIVNNNAVNGITIDHTFDVDTGAGSLRLTGGCTLFPSTTLFRSLAGTETFDNVDNLIKGTGT